MGFDVLPEVTRHPINPDASAGVAEARIERSALNTSSVIVNAALSRFITRHRAEFIEAS
jgi:hypothetical protein